jgi:ATP-dependent exoDNAse (exonuclease V) beta subunit
MSALELAQIHTIHGFCAELLRERPIEAGVDPSFEVLDDAGAERFLQQAFGTWFERVLDAPPEGVRRVLRRCSSDRVGPREQLLRACRELIEHRDFTAPWSRPSYDRAAEMDAIVIALRQLAALAQRAQRPNDYLARALRVFRDFCAELDARERARGRDHDGLEAQLVALGRHPAWNWRGSGRWFGNELEREDVFAQRSQVREILRAFLDHAEADVAARLQQELAEVVALREAHKRKSGALDFEDLLLCTRNLLRDDARVRAALCRRFTHLFVDEFQDIDPLQAEILQYFASDGSEPALPGAIVLAPGKLFAVGDPKQSIYRFRRADVMFYERIKRRLLGAGAELVHLSTSFRSLPGIVDAANVAFAPLMTGAEDGSQPHYVALSPERAAHATQPALLALPITRSDEPARAHTAKAIEAAYPDTVAAFVEWLLNESGYTVEDGGARVPIEAHHVCLLFRRFHTLWQDVTRGYVRALEARRIPHVLVGGRSLHGREEVIALRAALAAIEWPDDELSVYATLRGPFFAIADEELLCFRDEFARLHPLRPIDAEAARAHEAVASALALLSRLHRRRNRRPIAETITRLLDATRAHAGIAIWPTGEQALANLLTLADTARNFDTQRALSFRGFVEWLEQQSSEGRGSEAPIVEEGTEGVRLMTIHKAKGLEFPVVVLCDPTAPIEPSAPSRYVDQERGVWAHRVCGCRPHELQAHAAEILRHDHAENVRLAYVAATRARDLLVVPALEGEPLAQLGWVDTLAPALIANRSERGAQADWDATLARSAAPILGQRQLDLLRETERSPRFIDAHARWAEARAQTLAQAGQPSRVARPVTELAHHRARELAAGDLPQIAVELTQLARGDRPRGARFGTLVHAVLAAVPLRAAGDVEALSVAFGRSVFATEAEVAAAIAAVRAALVRAALAHPLLERAARARECRREVPMAVRTRDGVVAEGVIDLAFAEADGWTVVDFKTDLDPGSAARPEYTEQVRLYVEAVAVATGAAVRGVLLGV